jgi:hypothetical protein
MNRFYYAIWITQNMRVLPIAQFSWSLNFRNSLKLAAAENCLPTINLCHFENIIIFTIINNSRCNAVTAIILSFRKEKGLDLKKKFWLN